MSDEDQPEQLKGPDLVRKAQAEAKSALAQVEGLKGQKTRLEASAAKAAAKPRG